MNYKKKIVAFGLAVCLTMGSLTACGQEGSDTRVVFTTGFGKDEVFRIDNESCKKAEIMVYLTTTQNQYESVYGEEIWNTSLNGVTLEENVKETVLAKIAQIKTMYLLAKQKEITLSEQEETNVKKAAEEYFQSLNESEISQLGATLDAIQKMYHQYAMANKVYQNIIQDINPEISDDEARTITVQHILIKTYHTDGSVDQIPYSEEAKAQAYQTISEIYDMAVDGEHNFEELASKYSEDSNVNYSFRKGEMDQAFEMAAFQLETNGISEIIENESGYHIIKCLSTFNLEETDANKLKILEERRKEAFGKEYDEFVATLARKLNSELWGQITLIHNTEVTTTNFFNVYAKYFPG